jgi:predicted naringenin-chalcone synthase
VIAPLLTRFVSTPPRYEMTQDQSLEWLVAAHVASEGTRAGLDAAARTRLGGQLARALRRCACGPDRIARRGYSVVGMGDQRFDGAVFYDLDDHARGPGSGARTNRFAEIVDAYFEGSYADEPEPPDEIIHVTCTGYVAPNGAQKLVGRRGWSTRVTSAYHMGCYAALPALRIAAGSLATGARRIDLAHTELCSLHFDPGATALEQLVVQSLFADGLIAYRAVPDDGGSGLRVLAQHERILPDSAGAMTWMVGDAGMQMTLGREVPDRIATALRGFVLEMLGKAGYEARHLATSVVAVHPGGPKIIDRVRDLLELGEPQVAASRAVLFDHGNMSSATLPHIWMRIHDDPAVRPGTLVPSLAFGPGLTVTGALLEKR